MYIISKLHVLCKFNRKLHIITRLAKTDDRSIELLNYQAKKTATLK